MTALTRRFGLPTTLLALSLSMALAACGDDGGGTDNPDPEPKIVSFTTSKMVVASGEPVTLTWTVENATSISIAAEPGGSVLDSSAMAAGTVTSSPITQATTFTLTATGKGGTKTQSVSVTVDANAVAIVSFTASPNPGLLGGTTTLTWATAGATSVRVLKGTEVLEETSANVAAGSLTVDLPDATNTFTLEAKNPQAMVTETLTVTAEQAPIIRQLRARPAVFTGAMADIAINWNTEGASTLTLTANGTDVPAFTGAATGTITVSVADNTTFELIATSGGGTVRRSVSVARGTGETEPNDDIATANDLGMGGGVTGEIEDNAGSPGSDFFRITVPEGYSVTAETSDGQGSCAVDTILRLLDDQGNTLASDDDGGIPIPGESVACSLIDPREDGGAAGLAAGTYYIEVTGYGTGPYSLVVSLIAPECGNEILESSLGEQCDDGNITVNDGCSDTCQVELAGMISPPGQTLTLTIGPGQSRIVQITTTMPGQSITATTSNGAGGCDVDTYLEFYDGDLNNYAGGTGSGGVGDCAGFGLDQGDFIDNENLPVGVYFIVVYNDSTISGTVELGVQIVDPACGNDVIETNAGENCEDGNTASNDGCSSTCQIEPQGSINGPPGTQSFTGSAPGGRLLFYEVTLTQEAYVDAQVFSPTAGLCENGADPILFIVDDTGLTSLTSDDDSGPELCSHIDPNQDFYARLPAGNYYVALGFRAPETDTFQYSLSVDLIPVDICGNGVIENAEACDDGNTTGNDGCSATCAIEPLGTLSGPPGSQSFTGSVNGGGMVYYALNVNADAYVDAAVFSPTAGLCNNNADSIVVLTSSSAQTTLTSDDDSGPDLCSHINPSTDSYALVAAGQYLVGVSFRGDRNTTYPFTLQLGLRQVNVCGNGVQEMTEQCDDGNQVNNDNCTNTCTYGGAIVQESEPNDTQANATPLNVTVGTTKTAVGMIDPVAEGDFFSFVVPAGANRALTALTYDALGQAAASGCFNGDTAMALYDSTGTQITSNDDTDDPSRSFSLCSEISSASTGADAEMLAPGTYYLEIRHWNDSSTIPQYFLDVTLN